MTPSAMDNIVTSLLFLEGQVTPSAMNNIMTSLLFFEGEGDTVSHEQHYDVIAIF